MGVRVATPRANVQDGRKREPPTPLVSVITVPPVPRKRRAVRAAKKCDQVTVGLTNEEFTPLSFPKFDGKPQIDPGGPSSINASDERSVSLSTLDRLRVGRLSTTLDSSEFVDSLSFSNLSPSAAVLKAPCFAQHRKKSASVGYHWLFTRSWEAGGSETLDAFVQRTFHEINTSGDGRLSREEWHAARGAKILHASSTAVLDEVFAIADTDHDGHLSLKEFSRFFSHGGDLNATLDADDLVVYDAIDEAKSKASDSATTLSTLYISPESFSPADPVKGRNLKNITLVHLPSQADRIKCVALSPVQQTYATSHKDDLVAHVYSPRGEELRRLAGHTDSILSIAFSNDNKYIATGGRDRLLIVWDCVVGHIVKTALHPGIVTCIQFSSDSMSLFTGCQDNLVRRFELPSAVPKAMSPELDSSTPGVVVCLAVHPFHYRTAAFASSCESMVRIVDTEKLTTSHVLKGHSKFVWQVLFSPSGAHVLTCCENKIILWSALHYTSLGAFDSATTSVSDLKGRLWSMAVFGPKWLPNILLAFTTLGEVAIIDFDRGVVIRDEHLMSAAFAATPFIEDYMVCGDSLGNIYRIEVS